MMKWSVMYRMLIGAGCLLLIFSLFFPQPTRMFFMTLGGIVALCSLLEVFIMQREQRGQKTQHIPLIQPALPSTIMQQSDITYHEPPSSPPPPAQEPTIEKRVTFPPSHDHLQEKRSFFKHLFHKQKEEKKQEPVAVREIKGLPPSQQKPQAEVKKRQDIDVIKESQTATPGKKEKESEPLATFMKDCLQQGFTYEKIHEAAAQAHWPQDLIETTYKQLTKKGMRKKLVVLSCIFLAFLMVITILIIKDMFLPPYWFSLLKYAPPSFYMGASLVIVALIIFFAFKIKKTLKKKKITSKKEEEEHVEEIKTALQVHEGLYETDLDKLYALLQERKVLKVNEVAKAFNVSKTEAEEWGKILKDQGLAEAYYPAVGDMEIRWKQSKATTSR